MLPPDEILAVNAGIDWVTMSYREPSHRDWARAWALDFADAQRAGGAKLTPVKQGGYEGFTSEGFFWGTRTDGSIIRLSGSTSSHSSRQLMSTYGTPTRLDLQTTVLCKTAWPLTTWLASKGTLPSSTSGSRTTTRSIWLDGSGGRLAGLGSRRSTEYVRIYDKGIESGSHPKGVRWRIEAEYKRGAARRHWALLSQCDSIPSYASSASLGSFASFGGRPFYSGQAPLRPLATVASTSQEIERTRLWFATQIKPHLQSWIQRGRRDLVHELWRSLELSAILPDEDRELYPPNMEH